MEAEFDFSSFEKQILREVLTQNLGWKALDQILDGAAQRLMENSDEYEGVKKKLLRIPIDEKGWTVFHYSIKNSPVRYERDISYRHAWLPFYD